MEKIIRGIHEFQESIFAEQQELFRRLAGGQSPDALFITCSDSRINPNLLTQTAPGELFILRNAGNIIPPHGAANGGEGATIEYAVKVLGIRDIIICGHTHCGAMAALLKPASELEGLPNVTNWLRHAAATQSVVFEKYADVDDEERVNDAVKENVLVQISNLRTHPSVAAGIAMGTVNIHGWVYQFETGEVFAFKPDQKRFIALHSIEPEQLGVIEMPTI